MLFGLLLDLLFDARPPCSEIPCLLAFICSLEKESGRIGLTLQMMVTLWVLQDVAAKARRDSLNEKTARASKPPPTLERSTYLPASSTG